VGRASALLTAARTPRVAAFIALAAGLGLYYGLHESLWNASLWWDVGFLGVVLIPAVFGLVYLALPLWQSPPRQLLLMALAFGALAVVLQAAGAVGPANFAKLAAMSAVAWLFLRFFEEVSWVVLVALLVPWVDAYSVWRGPTHHIVTHQRRVFEVLSFAFPVPGQSSTANLGLPDLLFFSLFLGAAARFHLRVFWTWLGLTASIGTTMALTTQTAGGLPALPLLSLGFLLPNVDLLWRALRKPRRAAPDEPSGTRTGT
jgi:hypothetical protein